MICAIHQPNFFPWMGYFNKIATVDVFVFLDQVDFAKSGHSMQCYTNRVGILRNGEASWIHCPVLREHGGQPIDTVRINNALDWRNKMKKILKDCYQATQYYDVVSSYIFELIDYQTDYISEYNIHIISELVKELDLKTKLVKQAQFHTKEHSTKLLIELVKANKCDSYLYGGGGMKYQQNELFEEQGIELVSQNYQFPKYEQTSQSFVSGLSILDTLFYCGFERTKDMLEGWRSK